MPECTETVTATVCWQPPDAVLDLRAWAGATLWQAGYLDLQEAGDMLQVAAVRDGHVATLGQDSVQKIIASAFAAVCDDLLKFETTNAEPTCADDVSWALGWRDAAANYRKDCGVRVGIASYTAGELARLRELIADNVTIERAWREINHSADRAAASTVEALVLALRERAAADLAEPECQRRLANLSTAQMRDILARLMALRSNYPAIDDELLFLLGKQL
jgi:hypothetical protein